MEVVTYNWMGILIMISNQISMIESLPLGMCSFVMEVQSIERVSNRAWLQIPLTEAEYIAASDAAKEAIWIKKFVTELAVAPSIELVVPFHYDNNGAVL